MLWRLTENEKFFEFYHAENAESAKLVFDIFIFNSITIFLWFLKCMLKKKPPKTDGFKIVTKKQ